MLAVSKSLKRFYSELIKTLGVESPSTSHSEKFISAIGAFISMVGCYFITQSHLSSESAHVFVASMAASAVLLFAVPHGALSQPWPLVMGHFLSAAIGITCYKYLGNTLVSASFAVSLSVLLMYYLGCLHPPGGATAFFAVTSGADVHSLGFDFIWLVIMTNVACLLVVAIIYNSLFHWRRYPIHLFQPNEVKKGIPSSFNISPEDIKAALQKTNSFIDVTPDDLLTIFEQASEHATETRRARLNEKKLNKMVTLEKIFKKRSKENE